ncbi:isoprenoid synthase domain-containing protein [Lyophyllum atratum]|nr:isoprenoid synthase domain-containing protein [Lyophyllum atratum]
MWLFVAYITFWFLYDDRIEVMSPDEVAHSIPRVIQILRGGGVVGEVTGPESILQDLCARINEIAPGKRIFEATILCVKAGTAKKERVASVMVGFDEFFEYRLRDVGGWLALEGVLWAREITIPEQLQTEKIRLLQEICISQATLVNDLYSYRKEAKASSQEVTLCNALAVLIQRHELTVPDAIEDMKERIRGYEGRFMEVLDDLRESYKAEREASEMVERLGVAMMDVMGGNAAWSVWCGRYNLL